MHKNPTEYNPPSHHPTPPTSDYPQTTIKTTNIPRNRSYLQPWISQFHLNFILFLVQRMILAPQVSLKPLRITLAEKMSFLTCLTNLAEATAVSMTRNLTLSSWQNSWLKTLPLCSTQTVQSVMPHRRCQIMILLANILGIFSQKRGCFLLKLS